MILLADQRSSARFLLWTVASLALLLGWDASGLDLPMARWFGQQDGFPLREYWLLSDVLHDAARRLSWVAFAWLIAGVWWPTGVLRRMARSQRLQLALTTLLTVLVINVFKHTSLTSCPWDLAEFGGMSDYVSHWRWGIADGGGGHCFPAGHASAGFAFVGGYFVLRSGSPGHARAWLLAALGAGLVFGLAQQVRGAHFMSHTLWTGWLCWATAWAADSLLFPAFRPAASAAPGP
jgi:membrane-associated PAP2 superfamily phosphatase